VRPTVPAKQDPAVLLERLKREASLRGASSLDRDSRRAPLPTGLTGLDETIGGGLPRGRLVEVVGPISSGRTAFLLSVLASATSRGEHVAFVDSSDTFDPEAAAEAGVALERTLWIRPRNFRETLRATDLVLDAGGFGVVALDGRGAVPWARFALRVERSGSVLLALGERREAGTFAAVAFGLSRVRSRWSGGSAAPRLFDRIEPRIEILKMRGQGSGNRDAA